MLDERFKLKIQLVGALRAEAWDMIGSLAQRTDVAPEQRFVRNIGTLAYVSQGVLKEYDDLDRSRPAIINFIGDNQCFVTRRHNRKHYLQACTPCTVYYWDFDDLQGIYQDFDELKHVYELLCAEYDAGVLLRMRLLEMSVQERIEAFRSLYSNILPYLKRKDIANYLHISYTYFLSIW